MQYDKTRIPKPIRTRCGKRMLQIKNLRIAFGLSLHQAALLAALAYGEASD